MYYKAGAFAVGLLVLIFCLNAFKAAGGAETSTGIVVPLYTDPPSPAWDAVISTKTQHPDVPMIVVINPNDGPAPYDSKYVPAVAQLQSLGITVLGYVRTGYSTVPFSNATNEMSEYKDWYHVNGTLFDEMSYWHGNETYYSNLSNYSRSIGLGYTMGNPGIDTLPSYIGTVDNIVIYENTSLPVDSKLAGWHTSYNKDNFSLVAIQVDNLNKSYVQDVSNFVRYIYVTNYTLPNPYESISPFLSNMSSFLPVSASLDVMAESRSGSMIGGIPVQVFYNGQGLLQGSMPSSFAVNQNQSYDVLVPASFKGYLFDHWQDDRSQIPARTVSMSSNVTLVAIYKQVLCMPPASGDWSITSSCIFGSNATAPGNVTVGNNSRVTIPSGMKFGIDLRHHHLIVRHGSGVHVKHGGSIN